MYQNGQIQNEIKTYVSKYVFGKEQRNYTPT